MTSFFPDQFVMDGHHGYNPQAAGAFYHDDESPMISPNIYGPQLGQLNTQLSSDSLHQYSDFDDGVLVSPEGMSRSKRRQLGIDHIKHKRTRSGCYTCRQRRVKCDETHPTCERCRKGKRECLYPDPNSLKPTRERDPTKVRSVPAESPSGSSGDEKDYFEGQKLEPILDEEAEAGLDPPAKPGSHVAVTSLAGEAQQPAHDSMSPTNKEKSPISPADPNTRIKRQRPSRANSQQQLKASHFTGVKFMKLPKDIRYFIRYHRENITCHHYALKYDGSDFLKTTFLEIALSYEPLLYAITAFSAYFHTLDQPDGKISMFLQYYNKSVTLLRESLSKSNRHSTATLLTILQLATFEEYLGDWVNIMLHQKAAYEILTQLFTPDNIMQNETRRKIIAWYLRFDIVTGLVSGSETVLGREWHVAVTEYYKVQALDKPNDLGCVFEKEVALSRLLATEVAMLFGRKAKGVIADEDFAAGLADLRQQADQRDQVLANAFADERTFVKDFPGAPADLSGDIVNATSPDYLYAGDLWTWNVVLVDWLAIRLMFLGQLYQVDKTIDPTQLMEISYKICQIFEGMSWASRDRSRTNVLGAHASLGIAATTLPKDERHSRWCRRQFALIERCGYIYPPTFRQRMSAMWNTDVNDRWLPDDELHLPILRQIRDFIAERTLNPPDEQSGSLRDMRGIFKTMKLEEDDTETGPRRELSTSSGGSNKGTPGHASDGAGMSGMFDPKTRPGDAGDDGWGLDWGNMDSSPDGPGWDLVHSADLGKGEWQGLEAMDFTGLGKVDNGGGPSNAI